MRISKYLCTEYMNSARGTTIIFKMKIKITPKDTAIYFKTPKTLSLSSSSLSLL